MPRRLKTSELSCLLPLTKDWTFFTWLQAFFYLKIMGNKLRTYVVTSRIERGRHG